MLTTVALAQWLEAFGEGLVGVVHLQAGSVNGSQTRIGVLIVIVGLKGLNVIQDHHLLFFNQMN